MKSAETKNIKYDCIFKTVNCKKKTSNCVQMSALQNYSFCIVCAIDWFDF